MHQPCLVTGSWDHRDTRDFKTRSGSDAGTQRREIKIFHSPQPLLLTHTHKAMCGSAVVFETLPNMDMGVTRESSKPDCPVSA